MQFDTSLGLAKAGPGEETQAEIDRGGIECIYGLVETRYALLGTIEAARLGDQYLSEFGVDAPVPLLVGIGERASGHGAAKAEMVESVRNGTKTGLDISQAFAVRSEEHTSELQSRGHLV